MSTAALTTRSFVLCHLKALVELAGGKLPPGIKSEPDAENLDASDAVRLLDIYRAFLRSPRSLP